MNSRLYIGEVAHTRLRPVRHRFAYPVFSLALDLDELPELARRVRGFGYNRFGPCAIHDRDFLDPGPGTIREKLDRHLGAAGCGDDIARVELVTSARFLNYAFNPVSFYYAYRDDGALRCAVAEVNNTFGDRHLYLLSSPDGPAGVFPARYREAKQFHVSPFNNMEGEYRFSFAELGDTMQIGITLVRDGEPVLVTGISGRQRPLSSGTLARTLARYPLTAFLTMPRILVQAAQLYWRRRLPVFTRPEPHHANTVLSRGRVRTGV